MFIDIQEAVEINELSKKNVMNTLNRGNSNESLFYPLILQIKECGHRAKA